MLHHPLLFRELPMQIQAIILAEHSLSERKKLYVLNIHPEIFTNLSTVKTLKICACHGISPGRELIIIHGDVWVFPSKFPT